MASQVDQLKNTGSDTNQSTIRAGDSESKGPDTSISTPSAISGDPQKSEEPDATKTTPSATHDEVQEGEDVGANPSTIAVDSDSEANDEDSTFGSDVSSFLSSIDSSVRNYTYENGRRYHGYQEGRKFYGAVALWFTIDLSHQGYPVPNDEIEANREDMKHHSTKLLIGGRLQLAPIGEAPQRVLDVGTGTGIWAMDFADAYPMAEVIGVDLSPMQPSMWVIRKDHVENLLIEPKGSRLI
ncbi:MAG: hypothetical protein M1830_005828 [Pleopsidium flavum]|nr:MAG: hypothetical protein M1830_005828 [Pleopsidium flavum]